MFVEIETGGIPMLIEIGLVSMLDKGLSFIVS